MLEDEHLNLATSFATVRHVVTDLAIGGIGGRQLQRGRFERGFSEGCRRCSFAD